MRARLLKSLSETEKRVLADFILENEYATEAQKERFVLARRRRIRAAGKAARGNREHRGGIPMRDHGDRELFEELEDRAFCGSRGVWARGRRADWVDVMLNGCYDADLNEPEAADEPACGLDGLTDETRWDPFESVQGLTADEFSALLCEFDYPSATPPTPVQGDEGEDDPPPPTPFWKPDYFEDIVFSDKRAQMQARELYIWLKSQIERAHLVDDLDAVMDLGPYFLTVVDLFDIGDGVEDVVHWLNKRTSRDQRYGRMSPHEKGLNRQAKERRVKAEKA